MWLPMEKTPGRELKKKPVATFAKAQQLAREFTSEQHVKRLFLKMVFIIFPKPSVSRLRTAETIRQK